MERAALYLPSCLVVHQVYTQGFVTFYESLCCLVRLPNTQRCLVRAIYRKPSYDLKCGDRLLEGLSRSNILGYTHILIPNYYNLHKVSFDEHAYIRGDNSAEAQVFNFIEDLGLFEYRKLATLWRNRHTPEHLDSISTNEEFLINKYSILSPLSKKVMPSQT